jgi:hypothetical protein
VLTARRKSTAFFVYGAFVSVVLIVALSISQTKLFWYVVPLYPILSIMAAIAFERIPRRVSPGLRELIRRPAVIGVALMCLVASAAVQRWVSTPRLENIPQGRYGLVFAQVDKAGFHRVRIFDAGVPESFEQPNYTPQLHYYTVVWNDRSMDIQPGDPKTMAMPRDGRVLVTCDARYLATVRALGPSLTTAPGCAAIATKG